MGNSIHIYLVSKEDAFNVRFRSKKRVYLTGDGDGISVCQMLSKRLQLRNQKPVSVTLWLLDKEQNVVEELFYKGKPKKKGVYRVVTELNEIHRLRMKYGSWTDRVALASNKMTYAQRHAKSLMPARSGSFPSSI